MHARLTQAGERLGIRDLARSLGLSESTVLRALRVLLRKSGWSVPAALAPRDTPRVAKRRDGGACDEAALVRPPPSR
ncbi:hypothetical protein AKJ09_01553 [Labilithrix luteola]|uniref:HTH iclR-type domain-containing protein n=1 Tax=Labilithrix luteola TaxID=1391654 RepID=A0A0K1PP45_9BACT|nr:hypothetical protein AKJ09_01553 [Labilithrix luteola]